MPNSKDKGLSDLLTVLKMEKLEERVKSPGDLLAGIAARQALKVLSPSILRSLDKLGMGPGRFL